MEIEKEPKFQLTLRQTTNIVLTVGMVGVTLLSGYDHWKDYSMKKIKDSQDLQIKILEDQHYMRISKDEIEIFYRGCRSLGGVPDKKEIGDVIEFKCNDTKLRTDPQAQPLVPPKQTAPEIVDDSEYAMRR